MNRSSFKVVVSLAAALTVLLASALPAAAAKIQGEGYYSNFRFGVENPQPGIVIVDRVDADSGRINALLIGLVASEEYFIAGRSIGCNGTPANANRVFRALSVADVNGDLRVSNLVLELKNVLVTSIWVGRTDGGDEPACQMSLNFEEIKVTVVGDYNGDGAAGASFSGEDLWVVYLVEKRPNNRARVSIVIHAGSGNDEITVRGVNKACGKAPTKTFFTLTLTEVLISSYKSQTFNMTQNQLDALRSVRVRNVTEGTNVGCVPLSIIAILIG